MPTESCALDVVAVVLVVLVVSAQHAPASDPSSPRPCAMAVAVVATLGRIPRLEKGRLFIRKCEPRWDFEAGVQGPIACDGHVCALAFAAVLPGREPSFLWCVDTGGEREAVGGNLVFLPECMRTVDTCVGARVDVTILTNNLCCRLLFSTALLNADA